MATNGVSPDANNWGWWSAFNRLEITEAELEQSGIPNPGKVRLLSLDHEYTPTELNDLLQQYGSHLASLHRTEGMLEAQVHALKDSLKMGLQVAVSQLDSPASTTVSGKEGEVMSDNELFRQTKRLEIETTSILLLIKGWRQAYEQAWDTVSRIITLRTGELSLQTGRHT